jgi:hypothetical protein
MMTLSEREEDRLLHGKDYASFPDDIKEKDAIRWRELEKNAHADPNLETLAGAKTIPDKVPYVPAGQYYLRCVLLFHLASRCFIHM